MLITINKSWVGKIVVYLLLVNFINLTANFYHASTIDSQLLANQDPIDSLAELVLEFVFDMDDETIPDTEVPHEKKKFSDIKLHFAPEVIDLSNTSINPNSKFFDFYSQIFNSIKGDIHSPPPWVIFTNIS